MRDTITPDRSNWLGTTNNKDKKSFYSLALVVDGTLSSDFNNIPLEFLFNTDPQGIDIEEPAAVQIVPTQNGGQFVENQGTIYKNINIKGTTGLRPNINKPGGFRVSPYTGKGKPGTNVPDNEQTGFDDLVALVNFFRIYSAIKKDPINAYKVTMVWKNAREGEYYRVEPINFKTSRASSSPMTTMYDITLRTVAALDFKDKIDKPVTKLGFTARLKDATNDIARGFATLSAKQDTLISVGAKFVTDLLQPINDLLNALTLFTTSASRVPEIPRYIVSNLIDNVNRAKIACEDLDQTYEQFSIVGPQKAAAKNLKDIADALIRIFIEDGLFGAESGDKAQRKIKRYENTVNSKGTISSDLSSLGSGASLADINIGEDIRKVAKRLVGDYSAWKALVLLNDLKPPYISPTGDGVSVLRPGKDSILYPSSTATRSSSVSRDITAKRGYDVLYGRDIKLTNNLNGLRTISIDSKGDIARVSGVDNVSQAIDIKFNTEQGELGAHESFGIKLPIGVRSSSALSLAEFDINARSTLLSDSRIAAVNRLELEVQGNTTLIKADTQLIDGGDTLSLSLDVRK
jgi:hypothetical protein